MCCLELEKVKVEMLLIVPSFDWPGVLQIFKLLSRILVVKKNTPHKYQVNVPLKDKIPDFFKS